MHESSGDFPPDIGEPDYLGLKLAPSSKIAVPRLADAPWAMECKLWYEFDPQPETIETAEGIIEADVPTLDESEWPRPDRHRIFAPVDPSTTTGSSP